MPRLHYINIHSINNIHLKMPLCRFSVFKTLSVTGNILMHSIYDYLCYEDFNCCNEIEVDVKLLTACRLFS